MSRFFLISFFIVGLYSFALSQTVDTTYFDNSWKPCNKEKAKFFRLLQEVDGVYQIRDYYKTGILQMRASAISMEPEILDGPGTFYHPNGNLKSSGVYSNGKPIGMWNYYNSKGEFSDNYDYDISLEKNKRSNDSIRKLRSKIPVSSNDKNFSFALRGKVAGFVIIEDDYFSTATIGTEFLIKGRHSLGIDYTYFGWQDESDDNDDKALYETYERRGYVYFDYKYKMYAINHFDFYFNMYDKIGTYHQWHEGVSEGYNFWEKPSLNDKIDGTFNQVGAGLGVKCYLTDRFYIDVSANGGKLFSKNNSISYDSLQISTTQYNIKEDKNIFYMRINFGYKLFIKKQKKKVLYTN